LQSVVGRRRALLVGCNYPGNKYELQGCIRDVKMIKQILEFQYQYEDILLLVVSHLSACLPYCIADSRTDFGKTRVNLVLGFYPTTSLEEVHHSQQIGCRFAVVIVVVVVGGGCLIPGNVAG